jgi:hypothetical protein
MRYRENVERRAPAPLSVLSQLQVEALAVHPHGDVPDPGPLITGRPHDLVIHGLKTACLLGTLTTACQRH